MTTLRYMMYIPEKGVLKNSNTYFRTPSSTAKSLFFYIICAGEFFCSEEYKVERETYHSYLIMYIRKGKGVVSFNNRNLQVNANDVVVLNCHQPHMYYTNTGWETLWLHFEGNFSKSFFELVNSRFGAVIPMGESLTVYRYLSMIVEGFRCNKPLPEVLVSSHIHRILTEILLLPYNSDFLVNRINPVLDAITYIQTYFKRGVTVDEIAAYVKVSPFHFSRMFKKETGYSPYEYVIKTRIDHAKVLLKKTNLAVKEIAYDVGFNSECNFVSTFHERAGLSPNEFRNTPI